jgi:transcriptional regulator with XRE-family HTH domain
MAELGECVRAWRERLSPAEIGLPAGGQRRTTGLRREEAASLAGVSVDYLTRLEQGRATNPSAQVAASLARALRLTAAERDHLYRLARLAPPGPGAISGHLTPGVQRIVERLGDAAVGVFDATWTLVSWNPAWAALMGDPGGERNIVRRHFAGTGNAAGRIVRSPAEIAAFERSAVADLRDAAGRYPDDEGLRRLIADLRRTSPRFARLWTDAEVAPRHADRKTIQHPEVGPVTLDCDVLVVAGSDLRLVVHTAIPGTADAEAFDLIRVLGLQRLTPA